MKLANFLNILKYVIAPLTGAITTGAAFGPMGAITGAVVAIIDELLIHYSDANEHCLTYAIVETSIGNIIGAQIQYMVDEKLVHYLGNVKL